MARNTFLGSRGQAFDVFKLLIAAVIAGAILLILLQIIGGLGPIGTQDPNEIASNQVKGKINNPGLAVTVDATFSRDNPSIVAKTVASKAVGLSANQICVQVSPNAPNFSNFKVDNDFSIVQYTGQFSQQVKLLVICDRKDELAPSVAKYGYDADPYKLEKVADCGGETASDYATVCLVAVVPKG